MCNQDHSKPIHKNVHFWGICIKISSVNPGKKCIILNLRHQLKKYAPFFMYADVADMEQKSALSSLCLWFQLPEFNLVYIEKHMVQAEQKDRPYHRIFRKPQWLLGFANFCNCTCQYVPHRLCLPAAAQEDFTAPRNQNNMIPFVGDVDAYKEEIKQYFCRMKSHPNPFKLNSVAEARHKQKIIFMTQLGI